ncbi:hypothetical protein [Streptomyces jumonjinensis]|uniref:hypothetical protein n=1 Tax=Streptomyces jumonjinensis TaxID=1945 RepID=UPI00379DBC60
MAWTHQALGVSPRRLLQWQRAWARIAEKESGRRAPAVRVLVVSDDPGLPEQRSPGDGGTTPRDQPAPSFRNAMASVFGPRSTRSVTFEIDPLHPHGAHIRTSTSALPGWPGPRPPRPQPGQTPSGLPIRNRRYYLTSRTAPRPTNSPAQIRPAPGQPPGPDTPLSVSTPHRRTPTPPHRGTSPPDTRP